MEIKRFQSLNKMKDINDLQLVWKKHKSGANQTERDFLDFVIDGIFLSEKFGDVVSGIGCFHQSESEKVIRRLLLEEPADLLNNRRSLYVCPECGDLGCGAVSIFIEQKENKIIWRDFAHEYNYSNDIIEYEEIDSFIFDKKEYEKVLICAL